MGRGVGALAAIFVNLAFAWVWWLIAVGDVLLTDPRLQRWLWPVLALAALHGVLAGVLYLRTRWRRAGVGVLCGAVISVVLEFAGVFMFLVLTQR